MLVAVITASILVLLTLFFHGECLRAIAMLLARFSLGARVGLFAIVLGLFAAHLVEAGAYALTYRFMVENAEIGRFGGIEVSSFQDYLYFSLVTYTSLGLGDVFPGGHLRFIAGVEALNGLLLIAWSGSFVFLSMRKLSMINLDLPADR